MVFPWLAAAILGAGLASSWLWAKGPVPAPLEATTGEIALPGAYAAVDHPVATGAEVRLLTSQGEATAVLFPVEAPTYARHFLRQVRWGIFTSAGFERVQPADYVELGGEASDEATGGGTHAYDLLPHSFDFNRLPRAAGALIMDRSFTEARTVRTRYAILTAAGGGFPGTVVGQVIDGLDVIRRLSPRDALYGMIELKR